MWNVIIKNKKLINTGLMGLTFCFQVEAKKQDLSNEAIDQNISSLVLKDFAKFANQFTNKVDPALAGEHTIKKYFTDKEWSFFVATLAIRNPNSAGIWSIQNKQLNIQALSMNFTINYQNAANGIYNINHKEYKITDKFRSSDTFQEAYKILQKELAAHLMKAKAEERVAHFELFTNRILWNLSKFFGINLAYASPGSVSDAMDTALAPIAFGYNYGMNGVKNGVNCLDHTARAGGAAATGRVGKFCTNGGAAMKDVVGAAVGAKPDGNIFSEEKGNAGHGGWKSSFD